MNAKQSKKKTSTREVLAADVDLTPIMCLFIILVPLLLLSAVFERLAALQVHLPEASTIEETEKPKEGPSGIVELRLLLREDGLGLEGTLSHDPSGKEKDTYEDILYDFPLQGDFTGLQAYRPDPVLRIERLFQVRKSRIGSFSMFPRFY